MAKYSDKTTRWEQLLTSIAANQDLDPAVQAERTALEQLLAQAKQLDARQDLLRAESAEATRMRLEVDRKGEELRGRLAAITKGKYGMRSTKLKEFGLTPFKPGRRKPEPEAAKPPAPAPVVTAAEPAEPS